MFSWLWSAFMIGIFSESLSNWQCHTRLAFIDINSTETLFYPSIVSVNKYGGSFNTSDDRYSQFFVRIKIKNLNVKVFRSISGVYETNVWFSTNHVSVNMDWMKLCYSR